MKHKRALTILLLIALALVLGGVRRSAVPEPRRNDPARVGAESLVGVPGKGDAAGWLSAARKNPLWILQINAEPL